MFMSVTDEKGVKKKKPPHNSQQSAQNKNLLSQRKEFEEENYCGKPSHCLLVVAEVVGEGSRHVDLPLEGLAA